MIAIIDYRYCPVCGYKSDSFFYELFRELKCPFCGTRLEIHYQYEGWDKPQSYDDL